MNAESRLHELLAERILVLDGSGACSSTVGASPRRSTGASASVGTPTTCEGTPDLLNLTRPGVVAEIHDQYFAAGADIATTNTFTATRIGQSDYALGTPRRR